MLSKFYMNDLGATHFILGMEIKRYCVDRKLWLRERKHVERALKCFNMQECKLVKEPIIVGMTLYVEKCPKAQEEIEYMVHVPCANGVGSLIYAMADTRPYIVHVVGLLRRHMSTHGEKH